MLGRNVCTVPKHLGATNMTPGRIRVGNDDMLIVAQYLPGFESDLTAWELIVTNDGRMYQSLDTQLPRKKRERIAIVHLQESCILHWIDQIHAIDFTILRDLEAKIGIDDFGTYTLTAPSLIPDDSITLRSLDWYMLQGNSHMDTFRRLWDDLHTFAPFEQTRRPWRTPIRES
jgi:hypothetical protein